MLISNRLLRRISIALIAIIYLWPLEAQGQLVSLGVGYALPAGAKVGSKIEVKLGGQDWTPDTEFLVDDARIKLELITPPGPVLMHEPPYWFDIKSFNSDPALPREATLRFTIPADMPKGPIRWRVANANGGGNGGIFMLSNSNEVIEDESRGKKTQLLLDIPCTVSGRLKRIEEVDRYQFKAKVSGMVSLDLFARRIGSDFNGVIEIYDDSNKKIAEAFDTEGTDTSLSFSIEKDKSYIIAIRDIDYRGFRSFTYRLAIETGAKIITTIPAAGKRGQKQVLEFIGLGVATGKAKMQSIKKEVNFPADPKLSSFTYRLETPTGISQEFNLLLSDFEEKAVPAGLITIPCAITGRLTDSSKVASYSFVAKKGEFWNIACDGTKVGSSLDLIFTILGPDNKLIAAMDDVSPSTDPAFIFLVPNDGEYKVQVRDVSGKRKNLDSVYRLTIDRAKSGFKLRTLAAANVPLGGTLPFAITITREGSFKEPVGLVFSNLPEGVTVPASLIIPANATSLNVILTCAKDAPTTARFIKVTGTAKVADQNIMALAFAPLKGNLAAGDQNLSLTSSILVTTTLKPPFKVKPVVADGGIRVHRGATYLPEIIIERNEGFKGEITLDMAGTQQRHRQGIRGPTMIVGPDVKKVSYPVFLPEWLETARTSRIGLVAIAKIPDPKGKIRYVQAAMEGQVTMSIEGAMLKLSHPSEEIVAEAGSPIALNLKVAKSNKIKEAITLELILPNEIKGLINFAPLVLPSDKETLKVIATSKADKQLEGTWILTARIATKYEGHPVVSECEIEVEFLPASLKQAK